MKIRNGFVSNSSSSSFTCDVCGTTESGMDAGLRDFDMSECIMGHTFCNCHTDRRLTASEMREGLIDGEKSKTYLKPEDIQSNVDKLVAMTDSEIEVEFDENDDCYEVFPCMCPLCMMDDITENDALQYLLTKNGLTVKDVLGEVKTRFNGNYKEFNNYLRPPKTKS